MKNIIKSVALLTINNKYIVRVQTKSNKHLEYKFDTKKGAEQYYQDILID